MKIIIIDDEPLARSIIKEYLQYHPDLELISECNDGFEGLKAIQQMQPDLIFLDIRLPKIDGWELCKMLKSEPRTQQIPIVMLTGCGQPVQAEYGKYCGADAYLTKPWDSKQLMDVTRRLLARKTDD